MKQFTTITEKQILYSATHDLLRKLCDEEARLELNPDSQITKNWIATLQAQLAEINARIHEIEKAG